MMNPFKALEAHYSKPRARHTLPGDMRTEWLHGWWCGI